MFWKTGCNCFPIIELMILSGKNEENTRMKKAKQCLTALLSGVLLAITVLSGCGQSQKAVSKNDDHLTVYLWENRLMKNIVPYIHEQFPDQDIEFIIGNNDTDLYSYFKEHGELPIASGMKIIVKNEENGFSLKDITINDKKIDTEKEYSILLTDTTKSILKKINPKCAVEQIGDTTLSSAWIAAMSNGQQPSAPEDYIEVEK